ncbi:hypothetical protein BSK59_13600 [Paenibacillus odorifer]|uniref:hypothetical protein n=1 Tax=Paenibacillus odorifer TaxID=189426 RepID=UPI00096C545E|nr:hypothetical protein [Paenibacillus odorifer]OME55506.1 hypothetical protein BSK59_13600 [Paenibacillus odorifer]
MNNFIIEMAKSSKKPKIINLSDEEIKAYKTGLQMLGLSVCEDFFDLPVIDLSNKYSHDGLFYEIPFYSAEQLWVQSNQRCLVVVYEIKNKSSWCPLRIDFKFEIKENTVDYWLYVYDQDGNRPTKWELTAKEGNQIYTTIPEHEKIKLSELIGYKRKD